VAAAVEFVHCYSLVHDDLPAMDNSDLRRGRPTVHRQFDDAITSYERGTALRRHCETKLREAQAKVDRITVAADGSIGAEPARIE
jgi:geranylgeranyl pyrophosphate synthase